MAVTLTYLDDLARVRIDATDLGSDAESAHVQRSTDEIRWTTVRGGVNHPGEVVGAGQVDFEEPLDDYEFAPGVVNYYRVIPIDSDGDDLSGDTQFAETTVNHDQPWLKSVTRPFLNRPVTLAEFSEVGRGARNGVFPIVGRSFPVVVTDVRAGRRQEITLLTETPDEAKELDFTLAGGDVMFWQAPPDYPVATRHVVIGETGEALVSQVSLRRRFRLPTTEVAPPDPSIVGVTAVWQSLINDYGSWSAVVAAFPDWAAVLDYVGSPEDVIVA